MALQFNPPEWLIQEYVNRKQPGEVASDAIQQGLSSYAQIRQLQDQKKQSELDRAIKVAGLAKDIAGAQADLGQAQTDQIYSGIRKQIPELAPTTPASIDTPSDGQDTISLFNEYKTDPLAFQNKYGNKLGQRMEGAVKSQQNLEANTPLTVEQYSALQSGDPKALQSVFPNGIPRVLAGAALSAQSRNVRVMADPYGNPIRVPVAGGKATSVEFPGTNLNPLQKTLNPSEYKDWQTEVNGFDSDPVVKADRTMLATLDQIGTEISKYNKAMTGPLKSQQARAIAREVGALTDSDIARQSLDPSLIGRLKSFVSVAATGELPKDQLELLNQSVNTIKGSAASRISSVARERATRKSNQYGGKISPDELLKSLSLPTNFSSQNQNTGIIAPYENPDEEAAYQAWKAAQGK